MTSVSTLLSAVVFLLAIGPRAPGEEVPAPDGAFVAAEFDARQTIADAQAALKRRDFKHAIELCADVLKLDPTNTAAVEILAKAHEKLGAAERRVAAVEGAVADARTLLEVEKSATPPNPDAEPRVPRPSLPTRAEILAPERFKTADDILKQPVSADWQNAELDWVFTTFYETTGVNIVVDPEAIKGRKLTLHANEMPLEDVLDFIVRNNDGIQYSIKHGSLWITATDDKSVKKLMYSRIYPLNYGLLTTRSGGGMDATQGAGAGSGSGAAPANPRGPQNRPAANTNGSSSNSSGQKSDQDGSYIERMLAWSHDKQDPDIFPEGADYIIDRQTNQIMVFTTPTGHKRIQDLLDRFDQPPVQILIQTRFLDISDEAEKSLGVNIDKIATRTNSDPTGGANGKALNPFQQFTLNGAAQGTPGFLPGLLGPGSAFTFVGNRTNPQFQLTVSALLNDRKTKVLSQPQIIAVNNKESTIDIATKFQYIDSLQPIVSNVPAGLGNVASQFNGYTPHFTPDEIGFKLIVTPSVGRDLKTINLHLSPVIRSLAEGQQVSDFQNVSLNNASNSSQPTTFPQPTTNDTTFDTDVAVEDNGYVMIGGLLQQFDEKRERKIPGLSKIPVLGNIFKSTSRDTRHRNLMIIVEAHIIIPAGHKYIPEPPAP